jgi:NTP pyrophosphatase (non-canonical NTP hydrolase)
VSPRLEAVVVAVVAEAEAAAARFGPYTSTHEGYGVLVEEVAELLAAVRSNDLAAVEAEAVQVSAVALRLAECCRGDAAFRARSGA